MEKHTPGPWKFEKETSTIRSEPANNWLATMDSWDGTINNEANARLIAAAPKLLEALEYIKLEMFKKDPDKTTMACLIAQAIAKARGES
jgi:hypothetical protein